MSECKLYDSAVFWHKHSRKLCSSLGVNLLPSNTKLCNFNCIYCECGSTDLKKTHKPTFPNRLQLIKKLSVVLKELRLIDQLPDTITLSGNGEPTLHPNFPEIVDDVMKIRDKYSPGSSVTVFSNGTLLNKSDIVNALKKADERIIKLDAGTQNEFLQINQPVINRSMAWIWEHIKYFNSKVTIQSMFLKGYYGGKIIDNTKPESVDAWLECINDIKPELVMLHSINRPTAVPSIQKVEPDILREIAEKVEDLGIATRVN